MISRSVCTDSPVTVIIPTKDEKNVPDLLLSRLRFERWDTLIASGGSFVRNCNQGLWAADTKYVLYLNDDAFPALGSISLMYEYLESHPLVVAVGGAMYSQSGKPLTSCGRYPGLLNAVAEFLHLTAIFKSLHRGHLPYKYPREVDYVTGAALMTRRVLDGFDGSIEAYCEDVEYCRRVKSFKVVHLPGARFLHTESQSYAKRKRGLILESTRKYLSKYHSRMYTGLCMWLYRVRQ